MKSKFSSYIKAISLWSVITLGVVVGSYVYAASTTQLQQVINGGILSVDIVDGSNVSVANPGVVFTPVTFSYASQNSTGIMGSSTEQIYIQNPDAADNGWTLTIAASSTTALWENTGGTNSFDFNDTNGATDGSDADSKGGQLTVDPASATFVKGSCSSCGVTGITAGSSASFVEGTTDSINLLAAAAGSDDIGDWVLTGVGFTQVIPAEQPADTYYIDMVLTITAL